MESQRFRLFRTHQRNKIGDEIVTHILLFCIWVGRAKLGGLGFALQTLGFALGSYLFKLHFLLQSLLLSVQPVIRSPYVHGRAMLVIQAIDLRLELGNLLAFHVTIYFLDDSFDGANIIVFPLFDRVNHDALGVHFSLCFVNFDILLLSQRLQLVALLASGFAVPDKFLALALVFQNLGAPLVLQECQILDQSFLIGDLHGMADLFLLELLNTAIEIFHGLDSLHNTRFLGSLSRSCRRRSSRFGIAALLPAAILFLELINLRGNLLLLFNQRHELLHQPIELLLCLGKLLTESCLDL
mmetsp:Transcript_14253/g.24435  ORF Transcript_14253/g.24435 Transcript_14253/m.24435 type:complete len:298 (+) Transcript_14253:958-1851(+)